MLLDGIRSILPPNGTMSHINGKLSNGSRIDGIPMLTTLLRCGCLLLRNAAIYWFHSTVSHVG